MRQSRLITFAIAASALGACSSPAPWHNTITATSSPAAETAKARSPVNVASAQSARFPRVATQDTVAYRLDTGDRVRVVVAGQDALSSSYDVDVTGSIAIPSVGAVGARGLNTVQLSGAIARKLKQQNNREPHVAVQVETFRPFSIRGDVANPGQYPYVNNMTTETAIAIAGGLKPGADKRNVSVSGNSEQDAAPAQAESLVRPGDTIIVNEER